jgi:hypothetical protein
MQLSQLISFLNFGLESSGILLPRFLHDSIPELTIFLIVKTVLANTLWTTKLISLKTLAVKSETFGLGTLAANVLQVFLGSQGTSGAPGLLFLLRPNLLLNLLTASAGNTALGVEYASELLDRLWNNKSRIDQIVISINQTVLFKCFKLVLLIKRIIPDEFEALDLVAELALAALFQVISLGYVFEKCLGFTL